ncbi:AMP-binding protein [Nocardia sp. NPDC058058]|uniref:AMP-binding protein n=1 Tax=Nocardia sp. NPDC058058 TaxID=3346317 RepID=UPI0036DF2BA8
MAYGLAAHAWRTPDELAVGDGELEWTWAQLNSMVNRTVGWLLSLGVGAGQRVGIMAENGVHTALAHLATTYAGLSVVPINSQLTSGEVGYILDDAAVHTVLCSARTAATVRAAGIGVRVVAWGTAGSGDVEAFESVIRDFPDTEPAATMVPAAPLYYTSGTTGRPKGVRLPDQMYPVGETVADHVRRIEQSPVRPKGRHLIVGPMHHTGPIGGVRGLTVGNPLIILRKFDAEQVLRLIDEHRIESSMMVPTHFARMLALPPTVRKRYDVSSIRSIVHTGASCPVHIKSAMIDWFGPVLFEAYGSTEVGTVTFIDSADWLAHPGSVGRAMPGYELNIRDDGGELLAAGEPGLVCVRSTDGVRPRYHNDPDKTARSYVHGDEFVIGEVGYLDAAGYLYLTDRISDMVVSGGVNLYPAESEAVLRAHPGVFDVAVIGIPHPDMGEQLCALVLPAENPPAAEELITWCRDRIAHHKCPGVIDFLDEDVRTAMGKLDKRALRARYLATHRTAMTEGAP